MNLIFLLRLFFLVAILSWIGRISFYYFEAAAQDMVSLTFVGVLSLWLGSQTKWKLQRGWLLVGIVLILLYSSFPLLSYAVEQINGVWFIVLLLAGLPALVISWIQSRQVLLVGILLSGTIWVYPFDFLAAQNSYQEKLISEIETQHGILHTTKWKSHRWYYYNDQLQYATLDGHMYGEASVHPMVSLTPINGKAIVIGGEHGLISKELSKYDRLDWSVMPLDRELAEILHQELGIEKFPEIVAEPGAHLSENRKVYDLIILDLSDARLSASRGMLSKDFFSLMKASITPEGVILVSVGDLHAAPEKVENVKLQLEASGLHVLPYHAQIPTIGQWVWMVASNMPIDLTRVPAPAVDTRWYNSEAFEMMTAESAFF